MTLLHVNTARSDPNALVSIYLRTTGSKTRPDWTREIMAWCSDHNIDAEWVSESTRIRDHKTAHMEMWYELDLRIPDPQQRMHFLLRWS